MARLILLNSILLLSVVSTRAPAQVDSPLDRYAIITIPGLGGQLTTGRGIINLGHVTGASFLASNTTNRAYVYDNGQMTALPLLSTGRDAEGRAINDFDEVAGETYLTNGRLVTATLWDRNGNVIDLNLWGTRYAKSWDINNAGLVAGDADDAQDARRAILWENGKMFNLGVLEGYRSSTTFGINESGTIVGSSAGGGPQSARATKWVNRAMIELPWPPDESSSARDINDTETIIGLGNSGTIGVVWGKSGTTEVPLRSNDTSVSLRHINNAGNIVGYVRRNFGENLIYVVWPDAFSPYVEITDLLPPKSVWNKIQTVDDINDFGQMCGHGKHFGDNGFGVGRAYILTPVNPTFELGAPVPGEAGRVNRLTVSGATPGATVRFYYALRGGGALIPGCDIQDNVLQLENPKFIGSAVADGNGEASITRNVPIAAQGQWIFMQAVVGNECAISQLVGHQFK